MPRLSLLAPTGSAGAGVGSGSGGGSARLAGYSLLATSLFFAIGHIYQGALAAVVLFPIGLFLGWFYLKRKNLWELILLHTLYDSSVFILAASFGVTPS